MDDKVKPNLKSTNWLSTPTLVIVIIILILILIAVVWVKKSARTQAAAANKTTSSQQITTEQPNINPQLQNLENQQQQLTQQIEALQTTVANQQQTLSDLKNDFAALPRQQLDTASATLGQILYLLRIANYDLLINHDVPAAVRLLTMADQDIQALNNPAFDSLRQTIQNDIQKLNNAPHFDVTGTLIKIDGLIKTINSLTVVPPSMSNADNNSEDNLANASWTDKLKATATNLKDLVVIRKLKEPITPLLSNQQLIFLKQNVTIALQQAEWALLHRNTELFQRSIKQALQWWDYYPEHNANNLENISQQLQQLSQLQINPTLPSIEDSLNAVQLALSKSTHNDQVSANIEDKENPPEQSASTTEPSNDPKEETNQPKQDKKPTKPETKTQPIKPTTPPNSPQSVEI